MDYINGLCSCDAWTEERIVHLEALYCMWLIVKIERSTTKTKRPTRMWRPSAISVTIGLRQDASAQWFYWLQSR